MIGSSSSCRWPSFSHPPSQSERSPADDHNANRGDQRQRSSLFADLPTLSKSARHPTPTAAPMPRLFREENSHIAANAPHKATATEDQDPDLREYLRSIPFADSIDRREQEALEEEYAVWATAQLKRRKQAFGPSHYQLGSDMKPAGSEIFLPLAFDFSTSFLRSALRSPVGMSVRQWLSPKEQTDPLLFPTIIGGMVAGASTFLVSTFVTQALERRAHLANLPRFVAIDPAVLAPEPGPVQLEMTEDGKKRYVKDSMTPTMAAPAAFLRREQRSEEAESLREQVTHQQTLLGNKHWINVMAKPGYDSLFAMIRRCISTPTVQEGPGFLGVAMVTNGLSGGLYKSTLELSKTFSSTGQIEVPDLVGGTQRVNLFQLTPPNPDAPTPRWSDAKQLPRYLWHSMQESGALLAQSVKTPLNVLTSASQLFIHNMFGNAMSALTSKSACQYIASYLSAQEKSASDSNLTAYAETASQSFISDCVWNLWKNQMGHNDHLAHQLDRQRKTNQAKSLQRATDFVTTATELLETLCLRLKSDSEQRLEQGLPVRLDPQGALAPLVDALRDQLQQWDRVGLQTMTPSDRAHLEQQMRDIAKLPDSTLNDQEDRASMQAILQLISQTCQELQQYHALIEWTKAAS